MTITGDALQRLGSYCALMINMFQTASPNCYLISTMVSWSLNASGKPLRNPTFFKKRDEVEMSRRTPLLPNLKEFFCATCRSVKVFHISKKKQSVDSKILFDFIFTFSVAAEGHVTLLSYALFLLNCKLQATNRQLLESRLYRTGMHLNVMIRKPKQTEQIFLMTRYVLQSRYDNL